MRNVEIDNLLEKIKDMKDQVDHLYYEALDCKNEFYEDSSEWNSVDYAMDYIRDACDNLESAIEELN